MADIDQNTRIGLVGLGIMGAPIAKRLLDQGYSLTCWNLEPERYDLVRDAGATWAESPADVWRASDVVMTSVQGDDAVESVCLGDGGYAGSTGAWLHIDLSTSSPEAIDGIAPKLKDATGADWIDAPMSGGPGAAKEGQLTLRRRAMPRARSSTRSPPT